MYRPPMFSSLQGDAEDGSAPLPGILNQYFLLQAQTVLQYIQERFAAVVQHGVIQQQGPGLEGRLG